MELEGTEGRRLFSNKEREFVSYYRGLSPSDKAAYLSALSVPELKAFYTLPEARLFEKQDVPAGSWRYCLFRCGRGFGKSFCGACWLARKIYDGAKSVALYGPTHDDVIAVMVPALMQFFAPGTAEFKSLDGGKKRVQFSNGAICHCYSSEKENRGPNLEFLWADEICAHADGIPEKIKLHYDVLDMAVRIGKNPQTLITSTPKPHKWFIDFDEMMKKYPERYVMRTGTMWDNPFLAQSFIDAQLERHGGTRLGQQELYGELLSASEGALWTRSLIDKTRKRTIEGKLLRVVVGIDPAVTNSASSDETGIVVAGLMDDGQVVVLDDRSGKYSPHEWALATAKAVSDWKADCIVAESNNGGALVSTNIRTADQWTRVKLVHAKKGKMLRAEPVAALWEKGKASMLGASMTKLEDQMCSFDGNPKMDSPDRLDAMVYAVWELALDKTYVKRDISALPWV